MRGQLDERCLMCMVRARGSPNRVMATVGEPAREPEPLSSRMAIRCSNDLGVARLIRQPSMDQHATVEIAHSGIEGPGSNNHKAKHGSCSPRTIDDTSHTLCPPPVLYYNDQRFR
jgi:hypothetical protein